MAELFLGYQSRTSLLRDADGNIQGGVWLALLAETLHPLKAVADLLTHLAYHNQVSKHNSCWTRNAHYRGPETRESENPKLYTV